MDRIAAAILLTRGKGQDLEVYIAERAKELRFFGGYYAFPGGVRMAMDGEDDAELGDRPALYRCALRETLEETGLLLDPGMAAAATDTTPLRRALVDEDKEPSAATEQAWSELMQQAGEDRCLEELCRFKTPPFAPVRYDTVFFIAELPEDQEPEIWPGELVAGAFAKPADLLQRWRRGDILIVPPVIILLSLLVEHGRDGVIDAAQSLAADYRSGRLHRVQFTPGVVLAPLRTPTLPPATTTNCYLVGRDRLFIIDPGSPDADEQQRLLKLIEELAAEGAKPEAIVLTHHHPDHIGGVVALSQALDLPVHGHELTLSRLPEGFRPGRVLVDGDHIELGRAPDDSDGWYLEAVFTPGHDRGHLCFRDSRYDAVIVGDMISTISTIVIDPPEGHLQTYMDSLERLAALPMQTLYPAHGPAMPNGHKLVQKYIRHRSQRQSALATALREQPATIRELLPKVYWDVDAKMYEIASRSLLAGLQKLQEEGAATVDGDAETGTWTATAQP